MESRGVFQLVVPAAPATSRISWLRNLPFGKSDIVVPEQIHSSKIGRALKGGMVHGVDGLISVDSGQVLAVRTADCVPLHITDHSRAIQLLVHAGREGILQGIVEAAIRSLETHGGSVASAEAWIGPHVGPCCYRFPSSHPFALEIRERARGGVLFDKGWVIYDPGADVRVRLLTSGLGSARILYDERCTVCWPGYLPSHRREGISRNRSLLTVAAPRRHLKEETSMALDPDLLKILACPETKEPVSLASEAMVNRMNDLIDQGEVKNRGGEAVTESIDAGLLREDGKYLYPIRDDIPIMLIEEAIELAPLGFN